MNYSDSFPQADENPLSSSGNFVAGGTFARPQVVSNNVRIVALGDEAGSLYNTAVAADQFAQVKVVSWNNSAAAFIMAGAILRAADAPTVTLYDCIIAKNTGVSANVEIYKAVAGVWTLIAGPTAVTLAAGDALRGVVVGTTVYFYKNSTLLTSVVDAAIASGKIGLTLEARAGGALGDVEVDDFFGGDDMLMGQVSM